MNRNNLIPSSFKDLNAFQPFCKRGEVADEADTRNSQTCQEVDERVENKRVSNEFVNVASTSINPSLLKSSSSYKQVKTIDENHTELFKQFNEDEIKNIPQLKKEKEKLKKLLLSLSEKQIDNYMDTKDKIKQINKDISFLKNKKKKYLLENSKYIFQYFEDKKKISSGDNNQNINKLNNFFKIKEKQEENMDNEKSKYVYQNYWKNVKNEITNIQDFVIPSDICEVCHNGELISQDEEGILICNNNQCGKYVLYIIDSSKPTNKEPPNEVSYTAYIRLNHFKEILSQFQAKETTQIPEEVLDAIRNRIKKERIKDMKHINYDKMREILRKLGLNKYFEHIQYINSIFGIKPPIMNEELHDTLCVLFIEIQKPWAMHCPPERTNFFNYTYTLYQLCVLLDQTQYLPYIPLLKDRIKQLEQDMIWKKVCDELGWEFIPSI